MTKLKTQKDLEKCRFTFEGMSPKVEKGLELQNCWILDTILRQEAIKICRANLLELKGIFPEMKASQLVAVQKGFEWFFNLTEEDLDVRK